jgi:hypothetical protein
VLVLRLLQVLHLVELVAIQNFLLSPLLAVEVVVVQFQTTQALMVALVGAVLL